MNKKHLSMRWHFTLIVGICMLSIIAIVTSVSIFNAKKQFSVVSESLPSSEVAQNALIIEIATASETSLPANLMLPASVLPELFATDDNQTSIAAQNQAAFEVQNVQIAIRSAEKNYTGITMVFMIGFAILAMIITYFLVGRMLKPLNEFEQTINSISENNFSTEKLANIEARYDEIARLQLAFQEMNQRLETAFTRQTRFSLDAAHELKTPVAVIKTAIQVLDIDQEENINEYREMYGLILKNIDRLSTIIDDLLCFSNNEDLPFETVNLSLMIESIIQELTYVAAQSNIKIEFQTIEPEPKLFVHATLIHRALFNLIENAIKYNHENGHIWIQVSAENHNLHVLVQNEGTLMSQDQLEQIFEPFYRIDPSRTKSIDGYGLGLAISKDIIEKHHGQLTAYVEQNLNSFLVVLPYNPTNEC